MVNCPQCAELIELGLSSCPYCHAELTMAPASGPPQAKSSFPVWLLVIGGVVIGGVCVVGILIALLLPAVGQAREAARRSQCKNNLKQIGLALMNYHGTYNTFPPAYIPDATGKPKHSWRVLILPFIDQNPMHNAYDFNKPWDHPDNLAVTRNTPQVFRCPSATGSPGTTHYVFVTGKGTCFEGSRAIRLSDIVDGASQTLLVVESHESSTTWYEPKDLDVSELSGGGASPGVSTTHVGGFHALHADGRVSYIPESIAPAQLKARVTPRGREPVVDEF